MFVEDNPEFTAGGRAVAFDREKTGFGAKPQSAPSIFASE